MLLIDLRLSFFWIFSIFFQEYEEEFKKAQKPWSKKYLLAEKTKKDYHSACKSYQSAKVQVNNAQADSAISPDQVQNVTTNIFLLTLSSF